MATPLPSDAASAEPDPRAYYTGDMVRALNEANPHWWPRYETVGGQLLVTPAPGYPHQTAAQLLSFELGKFLERFPVGQVLMSPADISFGRADVTVQPDVFVMPPDVVRAVSKSEEWSDVTALLLVCEVLSPRTASVDRGTKRRLYQEQGVPVYWILDPRRRCVEVYAPVGAPPRIETQRLTWHPDGAPEPLVIDLPTLFARLDPAGG